MKKGLVWAKVLGVSAVMLMGAAGCGGNSEGENAAGEGDNSGVSNSIKSPVMDKNDDKAAAGSDNSTGTGTGNTTTGNTATGTSGNTAAGNKSGSTTVNGESNSGVSNSIKSPVMDKKDDKAMAGGDAAAGNTATKR